MSWNDAVCRARLRPTRHYRPRDAVVSGLPLIKI